MSSYTHQKFQLGAVGGADWERGPPGPFLKTAHGSTQTSNQN